jgi:tape measure domain-containing protein
MNWSEFATGLQSAISLGMQAFQKVGQFFDFTDSIVQTSSRLKGLVNFDEKAYDKLSAKIRSTADEVGITYGDLASSVSKMGLLAGEAFGGDVNEALKFSTVLQKGFSVSGASADEAAAATKQLTQGLASGVLRGDEFNSMMENAPYLAQQMSKHVVSESGKMGVGLGELRLMAEKGLLTGEVVTKAITDSMEKINEDFEKTPMTFDRVSAQVKTIVSEQFTDIATGISKILASDQIKGALDWMSDAFSKIKTKVSRFVEAAIKMLEPMLPKFKTIFENIGNMAGSVKDAIQKVIDRIMPYIEPVITRIVTAVRNLSDVFSGMFAGVMDTVGVFVGSLAEVALMFIDWAGSLGLIEPVLGAVVISMGAMIAANLASSIWQMIAAAVAWVTNLAGVVIADGLATTAQYLLNAAMAANPIGLVVTAIGILVGGLWALSNVIGGAENEQDRYNQTLSDVTNSVDTANTALDLLNGKYLDAEGAALQVEKAQKRYNEAVEKYGKTSLEARDALHSLKGAEERERFTKEDLKKTQDEATSSLKDGLDTTLDATVAERERLEAQLKGLEGNKLTGAAEADRIKKMTTLKEKISALKIKEHDFFVEGNKVIAGLINGMDDPKKRGELIEKARQLGIDVKTTVENELKIESPSKVFMKIGNYVTDGLALGISDKTKDAVKAVSKVASAVIKEAGVFDSLHASLGLDVTAGSFVGSVASGHVELRNAPSLAGMELRDEYVNGFVSRPVTYVNYANPALTAEQELRQALMKSAILAGV